MCKGHRKQIYQASSLYIQYIVSSRIKLEWMMIFEEFGLGDAAAVISDSISAVSPLDVIRDEPFRTPFKKES